MESFSRCIDEYTFFIFLGKILLDFIGIVLGQNFRNYAFILGINSSGNAATVTVCGFCASP